MLNKGICVIGANTIVHELAVARSINTPALLNTTSDLSTLTHATQTLVPTLTDGNPDTVATQLSTMLSDLNGEDSNPNHEAYLASAIESGIARIDAQVGFIKNFVIPEISYVTNELTTRVNKAMKTSVEEAIEVIVQRVPELYYQDHIRPELAKPAPITYKALGLGLQFDRRLIIGPGNDASEQVTAYVNEATMPKLITFWKLLFTTGISYLELEQYRKTLDIYSQIHLGMLMVRVATSANADIPEGINRIALPEITAYLQNIKVHGEAILLRAIAVHNSHVSAGSLIVKTDVTNRKIYVVETVYDNYIRDGGTTVALMGRLVSTGDSGISIKALLPNTIRYTAAYSRFNNTQHTVERARLVTYVRAIMADIVKTHIIPTIEEAGFTQVMASNYRAAFTGWSASLSTTQCDDLGQVASDVITEIFYANVNARVFIDEMVAVSNYDVSANPEDVAYLAMVNMVGDYLTEMLVGG